MHSNNYFLFNHQDDTNIDHISIASLNEIYVQINNQLLKGKNVIREHLAFAKKNNILPDDELAHNTVLLHQLSVIISQIIDSENGWSLDKKLLKTQFSFDGKPLIFNSKEQLYQCCRAFIADYEIFLQRFLKNQITAHSQLTCANADHDDQRYNNATSSLEEVDLDDSLQENDAGSGQNTPQQLHYRPR